MNLEASKIQAKRTSIFARLPPPFTPIEWIAIIAVGIITPLVNERLETLLLGFFFSNQSSLPFFDFAGGPIPIDLFFTWQAYGGILVSYLIRKPGAATLSMLIDGVIQFVYNGQHPVHLGYVLNGLGADLVFASFKYKRYDLLTVPLAGAVSALAYFVNSGLSHGEFLLPIGSVLVRIATRLIGGAAGNGLIGGALGYAILTLSRRFKKSTVSKEASLRKAEPV